MNPILKTFLALIAGLVGGSILNLLLVEIGPFIIPLPEGVDNSSMEKMKESMHLYQWYHFIFPFLAHGLGTLLGAFIAVRIDLNRRMMNAWIIGSLFFIGGIMVNQMLEPKTYMVVWDLVGAYFPMAWIGGKCAVSKGKN